MKVEHWPVPPGCWPPLPPPPEPDPGSLDEAVDWLTYPHHELYRMVHDGLDLTGAMEVSARWARLGAELTEIGDALAAVVERSATAWEGGAADLARETVAALAHWATDTATRATQVSACVTIEVDNATNARDAMPAPPTGPAPPDLTTGTFADAADLTADLARPHAEEHALHEQAARAMERFQASSREVYGTVPQFSPPVPGSTIVVGPPAPPPPPTPPPAPPPPAEVSGSPAPRSAPTGGPSRPAPFPAPSPGAGTGAAEPAAQPRPAAAQARPGQPGIGGLPMTGAGTGGQQETAHRRPAYLKEDEDVWGLGERPLPPSVIGDHGRA